MTLLVSKYARPKVVHLSHGSVVSDARVARALSAAAGLLGWDGVAAVGVATSGASGGGKFGRGVQVRDIQLWSAWARHASRRIAAYLGLLEMNLRMFLRIARWRARIVHCHDTLVLPAGWLASVVLGTQLVYDAHELESQQGGSAGSSRLCLAIERWCWSRISILISVSSSILKWYADNLGPKRSVLVLNSPVLPSPAAGGIHSSEGPGYFHRRFGIPAGTPVFVYLGLLVRGRGIEPVLQVFRRAGISSHVVFMGYGDAVGVTDHAERFQNIHLHPAVPHEEVVPLVREADCGLCLIQDVSLSDRLCLPNKLFEYAFAGLPVLASRLPEIERVVHQYELGICCDNDADGIEAAVRRIERDGLRRSEADLSELSWETQAKRLQDAYRDLLSQQEISQAPAVRGKA